MNFAGNILCVNQVSISSAFVPDSYIEFCETGGGSHSLTEKENNQVEASPTQNPQVSEDLKENNTSKDERRSTPEVNSVNDLSKKGATADVGKMQPIPVTETVKTSLVSLVAVCNPSLEIGI